MSKYQDLQTNDSESPRRHSPRKRLVNAVLAQTADDLRSLRERLKDRRYPQQYMIDAAQWVLADEDRPFSFAWCCTIMDRDPAITRKKMLAGINVQRILDAMRP
jgi:hypothetical protein